MVRLKFCGLYRPEDIEAANRFRPDYAGFILAKKGHRQIDAKTAAAFRRALDPSIQSVGVFIDEDPEIISSLVQNKTIDLIQLHGNESDEYIRRLKELVSDTTIIKAFGLDGDSDPEAINHSAADWVLLDYKDSGSGKSFDWKLLEKISRPFVLAGGINEHNLEKALEYHPLAIDLSSGIETDRKKDPEKMRRIIEIMKR